MHAAAVDIIIVVRACNRMYIPQSHIVQLTLASQCCCESWEIYILSGACLVLWLGQNRFGNGASGWHCCKTRPSSMRAGELCRQLMVTCPSLLTWRWRVERRKHVRPPLHIGFSGASFLAHVIWSRFRGCDCSIIQHWNWRYTHPWRLF